MTAERENDQGVWECPPGRANHYWDCEVLAYVAADYLGISNWKPPADRPKAAEKPARENDTEGGWIEPKEDWLR